MPTATVSTKSVHADSLQLATFYVADMCLALDISVIQEIIRDVKITRVPHALPQVRGVINLRGEVSTVIDLRQVLGMPTLDTTLGTQTMIVRSQGESIGLIVDRVGDICDVDGSAIVPPPPNVDNIDGRFFMGVCQRKSEIILVLQLDEVLFTSASSLNSSERRT
jgi:purine-binding chemotaxis protein CheW